jgi:hypothetical protein
MFLSKLKKEKVYQATVQTRLSKKVHAVLLRAAAYLQQYTSRKPMRTLHYGLFVFCLLSGGVSIGVAVQSFHEKQSPAVKVTPISINHSVLRTGEEDVKAGRPITEKEYIQIIGFRRYLDSLRQTPCGRRVHFRLLYNRRGLLDSLRQMETLYHLQQHSKKIKPWKRKHLTRPAF